jgi:hypothetical protein
MRRSAAPSKVNPAKRPRFTAPFRDVTANTTIEQHSNEFIVKKIPFISYIGNNVIFLVL